MDDPTTSPTLSVADEFGHLAHDLRYGATAPGIPFALIDALNGAAAAADQLGRTAYSEATGGPTPTPRVEPGYYAELVYGPGAEHDSPHYRPLVEDGPMDPADSDAARSARQVTEAANASRGGRSVGIELVARLRAHPDGRTALRLLAKYFADGGQP